MHEFSLMADLLKKIQAVSQEQQAEKVTKIKVKIGAMAHISGDHFREHFEHAIKGTIAESAHLEIEESSDIKDPLAQEIVLVSLDVI